MENPISAESLFVLRWNLQKGGDSDRGKIKGLNLDKLGLGK